MKNIQEDLLIYPGYYRGGTGAEETNGAIALVISPTGGGFIGAAGADAFMIREFALPPLPPGFVYTGAGVFTLAHGGATLAVLGAWEEQDGWNVGAAGFVLVGMYMLY